MSHAISFAYRGPSRHLFLTMHVDTTGIIWDGGKINGPWQILSRSTKRCHRAAYQWIWKQIPRTKSRVCMFRSRLCWAVSGLCGTSVRLVLVHVGLLDAMLGPYSCHVELMLSQERRGPFKPLPGPKGTRRLWIMSGSCWAYMEPMLGLCWSMLGPWSQCWGHIRAMLNLCEARNRVFLLSLYPAQKEHVVFGSCRDHVGRIWSLCWAYVDRC